MNISIKKLGERHDEATGLSHHEHGVFEGDKQIGSAVVAVQGGKAKGFKVKGLKTGHMSALMGHLKDTYGDQMAKAIVGSAMPGTGKKRGKKDQEIDLDHDRRRVKAAVFAMLGGGETPATPDGKVNLAKSLVGMAKYKHILPQMQGIVSDLVGRTVTNAHHDHAAYMIAHAQKHMDHARKHILQESPSRVDRVRNVLGLQPLHMKHLDAANTFVEAAKKFSANGDKELHANGHLETLPESANAPVNIDKKGYGFIKRTVLSKEGQQSIPHALQGLRDMHQQMKAKESSAAPVPMAQAPAPAPKTRTARSKKPKNDA